MPTIAVLWLIVSCAIAGAIVALLYEPGRCPESESGYHEDVFCSDDSDAGRVWRLRCLHCWRPTDGARIPWIRKRTHPTARRSA